MLFNAVLILLVIWLLILEVRLRGWKGLVADSKALAEEADSKANKALVSLGIRHQSKR